MPNTVILGHYYYGNLLFCCDEYLTHRAPEQRYPLWPGHEELEALSWLDYFILGDVYSLGLGLTPRRWTVVAPLPEKRERAPTGTSGSSSRPGAPPSQARPAGGLPSEKRLPGLPGSKGRSTSLLRAAVKEISRRLRASVPEEAAAY